MCCPRAADSARRARLRGHDTLDFRAQNARDRRDAVRNLPRGVDGAKLALVAGSCSDPQGRSCCQTSYSSAKERQIRQVEESAKSLTLFLCAVS